jgi:hypothetical protein
MVNPQPLPPGAQDEIIVVALNIPGAAGSVDYLLTPLDASLPPVINAITVSGGNILVDWSSVYNRNYQLQSATSLSNGGNWTNVGSEVTAPGGDTTISIPMGSGTVFYRVELMQ